MRILVTNDDGLLSDGLWSLARAVKEVGDVCVVAPDRDQSGVGTAKTLLTVLRAQRMPSRLDGVTAYAVQGTPVDCVILATEALFDEPFDLLLSGINQGANLGLDLFSSGTVAAALHGCLRGIPAVALSVASLTEVRYDAAATVARALARRLGEAPLPGTPLLNVNVPNVGPEDIERVEVTRLGPKAWLEGVEEGHDGRRTHYWIKHNRPPQGEPPKGTDLWAVLNGHISITPIDPNLANGSSGAEVQGLAEEAYSALRISTLAG